MIFRCMNGLINLRLYKIERRFRRRLWKARANYPVITTDYRHPSHIGIKYVVCKLFVRISLCQSRYSDPPLNRR